ncbi:MAG: phytochelatin synthase, partial [Desulfobacteraceae bacterium]|nr:phytochelatin synthase [Desulfobacteraceae bacterium]
MALLLRYMIRIYLYIQYYCQRMTKSGSFGPDQAARIQTPYQGTGNPIKDGLYKHHVKQFHESSCSVASVASVLNTLMEHNGTMNGSPVSQHDLLEKVRTAHWKERMGTNGYNGRRGLPLNTLGEVVQDSLTIYGIQYKNVEIVQASKSPEKAEKIKEKLYSRLDKFETFGNCVIISHFDQGSYLPDLHIPHISPVGGFNPVDGTVTLLDVDPSQSYPYQISFDTFYKGLSFDYNYMFRRFGYGSGGYIY